MNYYIYENTRYDSEKQKSVPYSYSLTWGVYTNSPNRNGQAKIAGQDRKVFPDKAAMEKYLNGRIKAYDRLFTEISPPIPQEYAEHFKVNGMLLPGYTVEGEEPQQPEQAAAIPEATGQEKEREHMSEQFSIFSCLGRYWGDFNSCPDSETMGRVAKRWEEKYGLKLVELCAEIVQKLKTSLQKIHSHFIF